MGGVTPLVLGLVKGFFFAPPREVVAIDVVTQKRFDPGLTTPTQPPHKAVLAFTEGSRVGMMVPSWKLREVIDSPALRHRMQALAALP